jgi:hypothetical protein
MRTALVASTIALSTLTLAPPRSWAGDGKPASASVSRTTITLSFKLDPRVLGPTYGGEHWVSRATYTGARDQHSVDTMVRVVDGRGAPVKTDPEWTVSDPEVLTVSPPRGPRVTITAKRAGVSAVTVKAGGTSRTFTVKAEKPDGVWNMGIAQ